MADNGSNADDVYGRGDCVEGDQPQWRLSGYKGEGVTVMITARRV